MKKNVTIKKKFNCLITQEIERIKFSVDRNFIYVCIVSFSREVFFTYFLNQIKFDVQFSCFRRQELICKIVRLKNNEIIYALHECKNAIYDNMIRKSRVFFFC